MLHYFRKPFVHTKPVSQSCAHTVDLRSITLGLTRSVKCTTEVYYTGIGTAASAPALHGNGPVVSLSYAFRPQSRVILMGSYMGSNRASQRFRPQDFEKCRS